MTKNAKITKVMTEKTNQKPAVAVQAKAKNQEVTLVETVTKTT